MDVVNVGRRVRCAEVRAGVEGTIVRRDRRRHLTGETLAYDILWDDGTCTRALSAAELGRPQWQGLPEVRSIEHCNERWYEFLISQANARAAGARAATPFTPEPNLRITPAAAARPAARAVDADRAAATQGAAPLAGAALCRAAQELLTRHRVTRQVALSASRRVAGTVLQVAWVDGPAARGMYSRLAELKRDGRVARIDLMRSASEPMLRVAIGYIHGIFYKPEELANPTPGLARIIAQATPRAYQQGDLTCVYPPVGHPHSSLSYQQLVRCVFERWDDHMGRFCDTPSCRYMVQEMAALFPHGDVVANGRMRSALALSSTEEQAPEEDAAACSLPAMRA